MFDLEIVIPVLNEEKAVAELIKRIDKSMRSEKISYRMIFVDDHSTDKTVEIIQSFKKKYPILLHTKTGKPGKAYSILEGANLASSEKIAMIDGDLQYPPEVLPHMFRLSEVYGVVVADRKKEHLSLFRRALSNLNSQMIGKYLLKLDCDSQSGLKVFRKEIIEQLNKKDLQPWALDMPLLYAALNMGYKIGNVEIDFVDRAYGTSKVNFIKTTFQIISTAISLKFFSSKIVSIKPNGDSMLGSGVIYKNKKYITHTTLPHSESALYTFTLKQKLIILGLIAGALAGLILNPLNALIVIVAILSLIYFADVVFGAYVLAKSLHYPPELTFDGDELSNLKTKDLPTYSILCPLYKEGNILPEFVKSIRNLDWPKRKLDVLILLEKDDKETLAATKKLKLPKYIRVIVVPDSQPRTKPKACNYGLQLAKGEYVVIFDAEDKPDPLQLRKAYLGFRKSGEKVFCLQSKLNYYNPDDNLLTRLFTAEYSLWFDVILPGLQSIKTTIPLGGTSNHFRTKQLITMQGWDPFNVTEDCDLGVRIFKAGYSTAIIDSTTYEEANSSPKNWVRQRSRWIKGYMQTYLVHMRNPLKFLREHGIHALIFQLIIGMRISFMLINPLLWLATFVYFAFRPFVGEYIEALYPSWIFYIAGISLVGGNFMYIFNYMIGCAKKEHYGLIKYVFFIPLYWILASVAAFKAAQQLILKPHFWEKTHHGLHLSAKENKQIVKEELKSKTVSEKNKFNFRPKISPYFNKATTLLKGGSLGITLLVGSSIFANFLDFLTSSYLGRNLKSEEFGLIGLMGSFMFIVSLISSGINSTMTNHTAYLFGKLGLPIGEIWYKDRNRIIKFSIFLCVIWSLAIPFSGNFFNSHTLIPFVVFMPVWAILIISAWDNGFLDGNLKFVWLAILGTLSALSKMFFSVLFVTSGNEHWVYAAMPISLLVGMIGAWILASKIARQNLNHKTESTELNLRFSRTFFTTSLLTQLSSISFLSLDLIFIKHFLSATEAGQYALLVVVGRIIFIVGGFSSQFILPLISKETGEGINTSRTYSLILLSSLVTTSIAFLVFGIFGFVSVPFLFGANALVIIPYLIPFTFAMLLFSLGYSLVNYHQARKEYIFSLIGVASASVQFTTLYLFHANILQVVIGMLITALFYLSAATFLHINHKKLTVINSNLKDLINLFQSNSRNINNKDGLSILIYNWRDNKHVWAGGAEVYVHELAKRWVKNGNHVTIFCGNDGSCERHEIVDGVNIIRRGGFYTVYVWAILYYILRLRGRYDVIVESVNAMPFFTPLFSRIPKLAIIHHVHSDIILKEFKLPLTRIPLAVITKFIESKVMPIVYQNTQMVTVSKSSKEDMEKIGFGKNKAIQIINPGIDLDILKPSHKSKTPTLLYLGRLKPYKSIDTLIKATNELREVFPNIRVKIAGFGESRQELERLTRKLGLQRYVEFLGRVSEANKVRLLGEAWVFVQPSTFEGWGISVLEANACGTPIVASRVPGLVDSVKNPSTGYTVKVKDEKAFAEAIQKLLQDNKLRKRFSANSIKWASNFSWQKKASEFMNIIEAETSNNNLSLIYSEVIKTNEHDIK